jgi:hypothetical protein
LHTLIFLSMGLFSFSLVMVAVGALIATPDVPIVDHGHQSNRRWLRQRRMGSLAPDGS